MLLPSWRQFTYINTSATFADTTLLAQECSEKPNLAVISAHIIIKTAQQSDPPGLHSSKLFQAAVPDSWQQRGESKEPFPPRHRAALLRPQPTMLWLGEAAHRQQQQPSEDAASQTGKPTRASVLTSDTGQHYQIF